MKKTILLLFISVLFTCNDESSDDNNSENTTIENDINCSGDYSTDGVLVDINEEIYNNDESVNNYSIYSWSSDETERILNGNGIPNHEVGTFPNNHNPNTISEQAVNESFTLCPTIVYENGVEAGGPGSAIAYALNEMKIEYKFVSRKVAENMFLYSMLTKEIMEEHTVIVNCSPIGTHPNINESPNIPYEFLTKNHLLFDLIYNPDETKFLAEGKKRGAIIKNGLEMLRLQAEKSWEIWNS